MYTSFLSAIMFYAITVGFSLLCLLIHIGCVVVTFNYGSSDSVLANQRINMGFTVFFATVVISFTFMALMMQFFPEVFNDYLIAIYLWLSVISTM